LGRRRRQENRLSRKSKRFFFEKKKQKTFGPWTVLLKTPGAQISKSFLLLFFKKEALSFLLQEQKCPPIF
jgi:hypothetical protein